MHGSEIIAKDVLEYVVFEKHLSNEYGVWRLHGKIIPDWLPPREPSAKTLKKVHDPEPVPDKAIVEAEPETIEVKKTDESIKPAVA